MSEIASKTENMMAPRVLISDKLSEAAVEIFRNRGIDVDFEPGIGKNPAKLIKVIGRYDGLAIRSATKVTEKLLDSAHTLKVIGRAGIGVDNIDMAAATRRGIVVMNTPFGNSTTTAEHTVSLMLACARQIAEANASTKAGKWEKSKFMGVEVTGKTLGLIGCGNIGAIVAERARGLKMKVIVHDPFLSEEKAAQLGVESVSLNRLLAKADFISLHVPLTDKTRNIIDAKAIAKMKDGVRLINCARGGLVVEADVATAIKAGKIAGAAFDVFEVEPAENSPLFNLPNVVCTPHLGASTQEAQENVAHQVAEQLSDYLIDGAVTNSLNLPSISAEEAPHLLPFLKLAEHLGAFAGQVIESSIKKVEITYDGAVADMNRSALTRAAIAGLIRFQVEDANMVSATVRAKERGIRIAETTQDKSSIFDSYIKLKVATRTQDFSVAGTVFADGKPRFIQIKGIRLDADVGRYMLFTTNRDLPGFIGTLGTECGKAAVNIANFQLGRDRPGGDAIALLHLDAPAHPMLLQKLREGGMFEQAQPLEFDVA